MIQKKKSKTLLIVLFIFSFSLYFNTINHGYVLDDFSVIKENRIVKKGFSAIPEIFKTHYREGYGYQQANLYRPLTLSIFAIQWQLAPDSPSFAHFINILLYSLLICVIYLYLKHLFQNEIIPFLTALLFAAHPIHTEVVANIKSLDDILAFLFFIAASLLFYKYLESKKKMQLAFSIFILFLGFLAKESTIAFLFLIPITLILFKGFKPLEAFKTSAWFFLAFLAFIIMRISVLGSLSGDKSIAKIDNMLIAAPNKAIELATAIKIMGLYLWKLVIPHPLMNDYSLNQISFSSFADISVIFSLICYSTIIYLLYYFWKRNKILAFGIAFYLVNIGLYTNLVFKIGTSFGERLLFIPSLGFCIILAYLIQFPFQINHQKLLSFKNKPLLICILILTAYSFKTIDRNMAWKDNYTLYTTDVENCSNSARCQYYYGLGLMKEKAILLADGPEKTNLLEAAVEAFTKSIYILPSYSDAWGQKGLANYRLKKYDDAIFDYQQSIKFNPSNATTWSNLGSIYFEIQRYQDAKYAYEQAIRYNPNFIDALANYASTLGTLGDFNSAITYFKRAIALNPNEASYYQFVGITYQNMGNKEQATIWLNKAKNLNN